MERETFMAQRNKDAEKLAQVQASLKAAESRAAFVAQTGAAELADDEPVTEQVDDGSGFDGPPRIAQGRDTGPPQGSFYGGGPGPPYGYGGFHHGGFGQQPMVWYGHGGGGGDKGYSPGGGPFGGGGGFGPGGGVFGMGGRGGGFQSPPHGRHN